MQEVGKRSKIQNRMRKVKANQGRLLLLCRPLDVTLVLLLNSTAVGTNRQAEPGWHIRHIWTSYSHVDRSFFFPPFIPPHLSDSPYLFCITSLPRLTSASPPLYFFPLSTSHLLFSWVFCLNLPPPSNILLYLISSHLYFLKRSHPSCLCLFGLTLWLVAAILVCILYFIAGRRWSWCRVQECWCSCSCDTICLTTKWIQQVDAMSGCRATTQQEERKQISRRTNSLRKYLGYVAGMDTHSVSLKIIGSIKNCTANMHL